MARTFSDQIGLEELDANYKEFVDKFKAKKTTDDCYTPPNIYEAVKNWVIKEYAVDPARIVRPFYPGGDYERFDYSGGAVVLDNPPFSIVGRIVSFYLEHDIPFFLFTPYLTNLSVGSGDRRVTHIISCARITYENGADVNTAFVTNLDARYIIRSAPDLCAAIRRANDENLNAGRETLPTYTYPPCVIRSTDIGQLAERGVDINIPKGDAAFVRTMDAQRQYAKSIFGAGFYLSERAERARVEAWDAWRKWKAAEEEEEEEARLKGTLSGDYVWELSEREKMIVSLLGKDDTLPTWGLYKGDK